MTELEGMVNVRYLVNDLEAAVGFYTKHFGFALRFNAAPAFADVARGHLRLLLRRSNQPAGRPMPDGRVHGPGGWNRIHFVVENIVSEVERLRGEGVRFLNDKVTGLGGQQILLEDAAGNPIELFEPGVRGLEGSSR